MDLKKLREDEIKAEQVLEALQAVCEAHNVSLGACGDCGSMWITDEQTGRTIKDTILEVSDKGYN